MQGKTQEFVAFVARDHFDLFDFIPGGGIGVIARDAACIHAQRDRRAACKAEEKDGEPKKEASNHKAKEDHPVKNADPKRDGECAKCGKSHDCLPKT